MVAIIRLNQIELVWVKVQSRGRVFLSESEMEDIQGVWIQDGSVMNPS